MNYKSNKAYTLIELLIVIVVITILSTIAFITLTYYSKQARDSKRLTDARNLIGKIHAEYTKGVDFSELIIRTGYNNVVINGQTIPIPIGITNFERLKENSDDFKDPSDSNKDYPIAYAVGKSGNTDYEFLQVAVDTELDGRVILGSYYKLNSSIDSENLFVNEGGNEESLENDGIGSRCNTVDIVISGMLNGVQKKYAIAACNVGATKVGIDGANSNIAGNYFTWCEANNVTDENNECEYGDDYSPYISTGNGKDICGDGYHVPTKEEWDNLFKLWITKGEGKAILYEYSLSEILTEEEYHSSGEDEHYNSYEEYVKKNDLFSGYKFPTFLDLTMFMNAFKISWVDENVSEDEIGSKGHYWSSTYNEDYVFSMFYNTDSKNLLYTYNGEKSYKGGRYLVRCFRDSL